MVYIWKGHMKQTLKFYSYSNIQNEDMPNHYKDDKNSLY